MEKVLRADMKIVMSDLNAKVGSDNYNLHRIMGRNAIGVRNPNGNLFFKFCSNHNLVIGGTLFLHKDKNHLGDSRSSNKKLNIPHHYQ